MTFNSSPRISQLCIYDSYISNQESKPQVIDHNKENKFWEKGYYARSANEIGDLVAAQACPTISFYKSLVNVHQEFMLPWVDPIKSTLLINERDLS